MQLLNQFNEVIKSKGRTQKEKNYTNILNYRKKKDQHEIKK